MGWSDGLAVKNAVLPNNLGSIFQRPYDSSQMSLTQFLRTGCILLASVGNECTRYTDIHEDKTPHTHKMKIKVRIF